MLDKETEVIRRRAFDTNANSNKYGTARRQLLFCFSKPGDGVKTVDADDDDDDDVRGLAIVACRLLWFYLSLSIGHGQGRRGIDPTQMLRK